jgi:exopolysaccharide biosynthesis polyprenyl glycosylphosphotransferase
MKEKIPSFYPYVVFVTDLIAINLAFLGVLYLKFDSLAPPHGFEQIYRTLNICVNITYPLFLLLCGTYRELYRSSLGYQMVNVIKAGIWSSLVVAIFVILSHQYGYSRFFIFSYLLMTTVLLPFLRAFHYGMVDFLLKRGIGQRKVLITGEKDTLLESSIRVRMQPHLGYELEAVIPPEWNPKGIKDLGLPILETPEALENFIDEKKITHIFIFDPAFDELRYAEVCDVGRRHKIEVRAVPSLNIFPDLRARIHDIMGFPIVVSRPSALEGKEPLVKRVFDGVVAALSLLVTAPLFLALAALIRMSSGAPVFFRQRRVGNGGKMFTMFKFRSMVEEADEQKALLNGMNEASGPLFKIRNDPRITATGKILRKFSLDELPQLLNVLRGELSLVGPRPPLPEEAEQYKPWQRRRLTVPQGITGLWQVSGRSRLTFDEMTLLDLYYIDKWSILLDLEILIETVPTILHGDGAF